MDLSDLERRTYGGDPDGAPCEHCGYVTRPGWAARWRVGCVGCGYVHLLCVDCGVALGKTLKNRPMWADMQACPDDLAMVRALRGEEPLGGVALVRRALRQFGWDINRAVAQVRDLGIPIQRAIAPESVERDGGNPGILLQDGREVYARP